MATYEITDSVLKRHHDQHVSVGGSPVADALDRAAVDAHVKAIGLGSAAVAGASAAAASVADAGRSAVDSAADAASSAASSASDAAESGGGLMKKLIPIALLILLAIILMKFVF